MIRDKWFYNDWTSKQTSRGISVYKKTHLIIKHYDDYNAMKSMELSSIMYQDQQVAKQWIHWFPGIYSHLDETRPFPYTMKRSLYCIFNYQLDRVKRIWYLSPIRAAKVQASLRIRAVSPEPSLLAHTSSESRGTFRQKARSLAPLNGWACAVKICHDGMLKDTNSLDGAQLVLLKNHWSRTNRLVVNKIPAIYHWWVLKFEYQNSNLGTYIFHYKSYTYNYLLVM